jgi:hypothetical protein
MLRIIAVFFALISPAFAQVATPDESLQEQLVPESFKLTASAIATKPYAEWWTTVSYILVNNSGMNLYMGILQGSVAIGSCTQVEKVAGGLPALPGRNQLVYIAPIGSPPPRGMFVPAGGQVAGSIVFLDCAAPNPGFPTAPLSVSLMVGKSGAPKTMTQFSVSAEAPIRQVRGQ